jgi:hypothetical protein
MALSDPNSPTDSQQPSEAGQQWDKAVEEAIRLFESHPDFLRVQVRMRERMAEAERSSPADARYYGTVARLQYVLTRFDLRAEAFGALVSDIQWQNAFMVMLESFERVAWEEQTGWPIEVLRPASAQADADFEAIHAKVQEWTQKSYKRLVSSGDETTRTDAGPAAPEHEESASSFESVKGERKAERKKLRDDYKAECKRSGVSVTDEMIAEAASRRWHSRANIQKWLACDPKYDGDPDRLIRKVFRDKPHLPNPHPTEPQQ